MPNRTFSDTGFWDRVEKAVQQSGLSKAEIARQMGVERKALYSTPTANGKDRSWHSGRVASFCRITKVSADWLLGLTTPQLLHASHPQFLVIDPRTRHAPIFDGNHIFKEKWFK